MGMGGDGDKSEARGLKTSHGDRTSSREKMSALISAPRPDTTAGSARGEMKKTNPFDRTVMFALSPRTYNATCKGEPAVHLAAQEVDMGTYDRSKFGRSVPMGWDNKPAISSRAALLAKRRADFIPDITFDLDGDGCVSKEDFAISLKADKNKDGRLDTAERKEAMEEYAAGRPARKFESLRPVTAPGMARLDSTGWPQTGLPKEEKMSRSKLLATRREEMVKQNHKGYLKYEQAMAKVQPAWAKSDTYQMCMSKAAATLPPKKIRTEEAQKLKQAKRLEAGLTATIHSLNPDRTAMNPGAHVSGMVWYETPKDAALLGYREEPEFFTRGNLMESRRRTMLDNLEESVRRVGPTFQNMRTRLEAREDGEFLKAQIALSDPNNRVRSLLKQTGKVNNVTQLVDMWGGEPEPPMNDARRATPNSRVPFWTLKDEYRADPPLGSSLTLRQSQKWWKKVPEKYLDPGADEIPAYGSGGPMDPYQRPHTRKENKEENMAPKVTTTSTSVKDMDPTLKVPYIPRHAPKAELRQKADAATMPPNYLTDSAMASLADQAKDVPMFSSFSPDFVFKAPVLTAGAKDRSASRVSGMANYSSMSRGAAERASTAARKELEAPRRMQDVLRQSAGAVAPGDKKSLLRAGTKLRTAGFSQGAQGGARDDLGSSLSRPYTAAGV